MKKNRIKIILVIFLSLFFLQACAGTKNRFKGKTARPDQIHPISGIDNARVWETKELSVNFLFTPSLPDNFNLTGNISISTRITNTFYKIRKLFFLISFLDTHGKVICTKAIPLKYSVNSKTPKKIKFNLNSSLPDEAVSFCFSYSGEFEGDSDIMDSIQIGQKPF